MLPFPIYSPSGARFGSWEKISNVFGLETYYFMDDNEHYIFRDKEYKEPLRKDEPKLFEKLIGKAKAIIDGKFVLKDYPLIETRDDKHFIQVYKAVVWVEEKNEDVDKKWGGCKITTEEGRLILIDTEARKRLVFKEDQYCGVTPQLIQTRAVLVFEEEENIFKYPDFPIRLKYLPLISQESGCVPEKITSSILEYTLQLAGRDGVTKIRVIPEIERKTKGTILLWPNFKCERWKSYYFYSDGEDFFRELNLDVILTEKDQEHKFDISSSIPMGKSYSITRNVGEVGYRNWGEKALNPRFITISRKGIEYGAFNVKLYTKYFGDITEQWGIDFGTSESVIAFKIMDEEITQNIRKDMTLEVLTFSESIGGTISVEYSPKIIHQSGKWFPTYEKTSQAEDEYILSELVFANLSEIKPKDLGSYFPGQDFHLISTEIDTLKMLQNWVGNFKWKDESWITDISPLRKGFLFLTLLMACADRFNHEHVPRKIQPVLTYPLRMGAAGRESLAKDFKYACDACQSATGFEFGEPKYVSESVAITVEIPRDFNAVVADLGGASLDLWIGNSKTRDENYAADSILFGGLSFLRYLSKHRNKEVCDILNSKQKDSKRIDFFLRRFVRQSRAEVKERFETRADSTLRKIQQGFITLVIEYISRILAAYVLNHKERLFKESDQPVFYLILTGNGWKLDFSVDLWKMPKYFADRVQDRCNNLLKNEGVRAIKVEKWLELKKKDSLAISAAKWTEKGDDIEQKTVNLSTFSGMDMTSPSNMNWFSPIPLSLGGALDAIREVKLTVHPVKDRIQINPDLTSHFISTKVYSEFDIDLRKTFDTRIYNVGEGKQKIWISPFGLLLEKMREALSDVKE